MPASPLRPVVLTGSRWQVMYLSLYTAKKIFPGDKCEQDSHEGIIKIHRHSFFRGDTLMTVSFNRINDNVWLVHVVSEGAGWNQPLDDRSNKETELYLKALEDTYKTFK
jgi:hypothetical protein